MAKSLAIRVYDFHGFILKVGPRLGGPFVKLVAYFALYKIFTNGGVEALAFIAYEHMLKKGEEERNANRQNKAQK